MSPATRPRPASPWSYSAQRRPAARSSTPASSPAPTGPRFHAAVDALGRPPERRVRQRPRQERHPVGLDHRPDRSGLRRRAREGLRGHDRQRVARSASGPTSTPPTSTGCSTTSAPRPTAPTPSSSPRRQRLRLHQPHRRDRLRRQRLHRGRHLRDRLDEFRIVYDFSPRPTRSPSAPAPADAWTPLKAAGASGPAIPFRGANTITQSHGNLFRAYQNANMWLDDVRLRRRRHHRPRHHAAERAGRPARRRPPRRPGRLDRPVLDRCHRQRRRDRLQALPRHRPRRLRRPDRAVGNVTAYTDATAVTGTRYYYAVSAARRRRQRGPASPSSPPSHSTTSLRPSPAGLAAVGGTNQVALTWSANTEPDLAGYDVYRDGVKINATPVSRHELHRHRTRRRHHLLLPRHRRQTPTATQAHRAPRSRPPRSAPRRVTLPLDGTFESGTDGAALLHRPGRSRAPPSAPSTTPPAPRTAPCPAGSRARGRRLRRRAREGLRGHDRQRRRDPLLGLLRHDEPVPRVLDDFGATADRASPSSSPPTATSTRLHQPHGATGYAANAYTAVGTYATGWTSSASSTTSPPRPTRCPSARAQPTPGRR